MSLSANPLATLWSKAPTKPTTPSSANVDNAVAARGLETAPKTPSNFSHQREVSPNDDQENRGAIVGTPSTENAAPALATPRLRKEHTDKLRAWLVNNPNPGKREREQMAKRLGLHFSQVTSWYQRNKSKRKADALAEPGAHLAAPAGASSTADVLDTAQPVHADAVAADAAMDVIMLSDDDASSSGEEPAAKWQKTSGSESPLAADAASHRSPAANAANDSAPRPPLAAQATGQHSKPPLKPAGEVLLCAGTESAGKAQPHSVPQPLTPAAGQQAATAATPTTGSPAAARPAMTAAPDQQPSSKSPAPTDGCTPPYANPPAAEDLSAAPAAQIAPALAKAVQQLQAGAAPPAEVCVELMQHCQQRKDSMLASLCAEGPLQPLPALGSLHPFSKAQVAAFVMGSSEPLPVLVGRLTAVMTSADAGHPVTEMLVQNTILELASRRSYGVKDGRAEQADALTDDTSELLWRWDVRDAKVLGKGLRSAATDSRKRLVQGQKDINVFAAACKALAMVSTGKVAAKRAGKALEKVLKETAVSSPAGTPPATTSGGAAAATPVPLRLSPAGTPSQAAAAEDQSPEMAAKASLKEHEQQEKLAQKAQKTAEQEAARAEKEAQRAAKAAEKAQRDAQRDAARKQKEEERNQKAAQKKGFDTKSLHKTQNLLMAFVKTAPPKPAVEEPVVRHPEPAAVATTGCIDAAMDAAKHTASASDLEAGSKQILESWAAQRGHHKHVFGLPPTWARKRDALRVLSRLHEERFGAGFEPAEVPTHRRKFLWHSGWDMDVNPRRPPFYGSFTRTSAAVRPRRPFGQDDVMDYEVDSEDEWEEEPEDGEQLSDDDAMSADENAGGSEAGSGSGFVVDDGYLSQEEGVSLENDENIEPLDADMLEPAAGMDHDEAAAADRWRKANLLSGAIARAAKSNKPLIISALQAPSDSENSAQTDVATGSVAWLSALSAQIVTPGIYITVPPDDDAQVEQQLGAIATAASATVPGPGRPSAAAMKAREQELVPQLIRFLLDHPRLKAREKVIRGFREQHAAAPKKWLERRIKEDAVHTGDQWVVKAEVLRAFGMEKAAEAMISSVPAAFCGQSCVALPAKPETHTASALPAAAAAAPHACVAMPPVALPAAVQKSAHGSARAAASVAPAASCVAAGSAPGSAAAPAEVAAPALPQMTGPAVSPTAEAGLASPRSSSEALAPTDPRSPSPALQHSTRPVLSPTAETWLASPWCNSEALAPFDPRSPANIALAPLQATSRLGDEAGLREPAGDEDPQPMEGLEHNACRAQANEQQHADETAEPSAQESQQGAEAQQQLQQLPASQPQLEQPQSPPTAAQPPQQPSSQQPVERLELPPGGHVNGTGHPFWRALSALLAGGQRAADGDAAHEDLLAGLEVFCSDTIQDTLASVPASIVSALIKAAGSRGLAATVQMGCMQALSNLVHALRLRPPEHVDYRNPSLMFAGQRAAPLAASLPELYADTGLVPALARWLLPPRLPLDPAQPLPQGTRTALALLVRLVTVGLLPPSGSGSGPQGTPLDAAAGPDADAAAAVFRLRLLGAEPEGWCEALTAVVRRGGQNAADTRAATMAALVASLLTADTATRAALSDTSKGQRLVKALLQAAVGAPKAMMKHVTRAVHALMQDADAHDLLLNLYGSARLREARRADLARYFGAQLAPSAALQAADATLTQALEAMDTWARSDDAAVPLLLVQVEPSTNSDDDAFVMQSGTDATIQQFVQELSDDATRSMAVRSAAQDSFHLLNGEPEKSSSSEAEASGEEGDGDCGSERPAKRSRT